MHQFFTPDISANNYTLSEEESKHCIRVLRLKSGDKIQLLDGKGNLYVAEITDEHPKKCSVQIVEKHSHTAKKWELHMAIAPTKNMDRLEWFIEKATEIGINTIVPITCKNSERVVLKTERLVKVAIAAIKQSLNPFLPNINELSDFKKIIAQYNDFKGQKFIAHCQESLGESALPFSGKADKANEAKPHIKSVYTKNENAFILIGPEGDFTKEEVELAIANGFKEISLGENRLRTETAALYACTVFNIINEN